MQGVCWTETGAVLQPSSVLPIFVLPALGVGLRLVSALPISALPAPVGLRLAFVLPTVSGVVLRPKFALS